MKNPLKWYHLAGRELVCWLRGHNRKTSWHRKINFNELQEMPFEEFSYGLRNSGNPYYEYVSQGWHVKCRRCRWVTKEEIRDSFHVRWYKYITGFWRYWWITFTCVIKYETNIKKYPMAPILATLSGLIQATAARAFDQNNGIWPIDFFIEVEEKMYKWISDRG
jgi:hypothetical protein